MRKYKKFDIATRVQYVEEYLDLLKSNNKIKISEFAHNKGLADSTFNDWLIKYKKDKSRFISGNADNNGVINLSPSVAPTFIEISKEKLNDVPITNASSIKLNYKDVSLEFNSNNLDKVMEILRRW